MSDVGIKTKREFDPEEAVRAYEKPIDIPDWGAHGERDILRDVMKWLAEWIECPDCKGEGKITVEAYYRHTVCYLCGGSGKIQRVNDPKFWRK